MLIELALLGSTIYFFTRPKNKKTAKQPLVSYKKVLHEVKSALFGEIRQQQQLLLDPKRLREIQLEKESMNRDLAIVVIAMGMALLGSINPIFTGIGVVMQLYLIREGFRRTWLDLKAGRLITIYTVGMVTFLGVIAQGYLLLSTISALVGNTFFRTIRRIEENSKQQLVNVFGEHPSRVWVEKNGVEIEVDFDSLQAGDIVIVNAGEIIPVDGVIQQGTATIDQHLLTGESQPVERGENDQVFAATLLLTGRIRVMVETAGQETVAAKIGQVLDHTQYYKDHLMMRGREIANRFLPVTLALATLTWQILGSTAALAVLLAPLGITMAWLGPLTLLTYLHILSRQGILVKDGRILESLRDIDTIVFDKTGTLTLEQPSVGQIHALSEYNEDTVLRFAAAAEYRQPHPIAKAILAKAEAAQLNVPEPDEAGYEVGYGIKVKIEQHTIRVGSARFMQREGIALPDRVRPIQQQAEEEGFSLIYVGIDQYLGGILEMHPSIRPEAADIIHALKQRGIELYIISGDHEKPTRSLANQLGIDHYFAEILPENKADLVKQLREQGKFVCFIGDGINDAIALKSAQVSISLKGASTAATDTAQIIFMDGTLGRVEQLFQLADEFESTMRINFLTSIIPGMICISGVYLLHFRLVATLLIAFIGDLMGSANSLWPLVKHHYHTAESETALEKVPAHLLNPD